MSALIRLALAGDARVTYTLWSNCHWQLLDFDSLRGAPPRRGRLWKRIVTRGNPTVIPGTDSGLVGVDALIDPMGNVLKLEWVDVLNRPLQILMEVF